MKLNRLVILPALLLAAVAQADSLASIFTNADMSGAPDRRTSIIVIQCHGLGYGDLSCYGQTNFETPNLDKLAAEGIRFTNFRPGGTNFSDALTILMTGKNSASANAPTVAGQLQAAGYATGLIGEWTVDAHPWLRGFENFAGFLNTDDSRNYFAPMLWSFDPNNTYDEAAHMTVAWKPGSGPHNVTPEVIYANSGGHQVKYMPELLINAMCNFVRINQPDVFNHYKPFFLLVDFPAPRSAAVGADVFPVPSDAPFTDEPWPQAAKNRASLMLRLDGSIGRLFDQLHQLGVSNNVAIFFSSSEAPEKFADAKMNFLSPNGSAAAGTDGTAAQLPMIAYWPEQIPAGQVSDFKWTGVDFMPTVLNLSYIKPPKDLDGISILPVLEGKKGPTTDAPANGQGAH